MTAPTLREAEARLRANGKARLRWVEPDLGYPGRIVNLRIGKEACHFIATADGARLGKGEYPAPDATLLLSDGKVWDQLASGGLSVGEAMRSGRARVWGNLNDIQAFLRIVARKD